MIKTIIRGEALKQALERQDRRVPQLAERERRDAERARAWLKPDPRDPAEDDPDPTY